MDMLDMERRTGIKNHEIDDWVKKTTALEAAIKGMADGTLDPATVSLAKYGIYTEEEQKAEDDRRAKNKKEMEERVAREKEAEKQEERRKWWDGATFLYGPRVGSEEFMQEAAEADQVSLAARLKRTEEDNQRLVDRYSLDYNRWNTSKYKPDDPATKEEEEVEQKNKDDAAAANFEKVNSEWCGEMKEDMAKRNASRDKRDSEANALRLKGNISFQKKDYKRAHDQYMEALHSTPYKTNLLTNIAICHTKLAMWEDGLEFCDRALHVDKTCVKALSRRAVCRLSGVDSSSKAAGGAAASDAAACKLDEATLRELRIKALEDLTRAMSLEPANEDVEKQRRGVAQDLEDEAVEAALREAVRKEEDRVKAARESAERTNKAALASPSRAAVEEKKSDGAGALAPDVMNLTQKWLGKGLEAMKQGKGFDELPPVSEFEMIDHLVSQIVDNGVLSSPLPSSSSSSSSASTTTPTSIPAIHAVAAANATLFGAPTSGDNIANVLVKSLASAQDSRVYLRTSGHLSRLCSRATSSDPALASEKAGLFLIIAAAVEAQRRSKDMAYDSMAVAAAVAMLYSHEGPAKQSVETRIAACKFIDTCIDDAGGESTTCTKLVYGDIGIVHSLVKLLHEIAVGPATKTTLSDSSTAFWPLSLLRDVAKNEKTQKAIESAFPAAPIDSSSSSSPSSSESATPLTLSGDHHPVGAAILVMTRSAATEDIREVAVCALSNLALSPCTRGWFAVPVSSVSPTSHGDAPPAVVIHANGVQALLAVARSHKTETAAARSIALATLMNCSIAVTTTVATVVNTDSENDANGIKRAIAKVGGLPILCALINSDKDKVAPLILKQRAAGLLGRCVTSPPCALAIQGDGNATKVCESFVKLVLTKGGGEGSESSLSFDTPCPEDPSSVQAMGEMVVQLVRCLAVFKPSPVGVEGYVTALVKLLPAPRVDGIVGITAGSVCMPPIPPVEHSAAAAAAKDQTLVANASKALIAYLDSGKVDVVVKNGGLERLICTLANNSKFSNASVRKNAAAALARIVTNDEAAMARCRELRGMEILVELGNTGKV